MGDIQGPSKQPKLNVASTPPSQLLRFIATYCYVPRFNQLLSRHGNHGPLFTRRRSVVSPLIRAETPLTYPRAYQHPLRVLKLRSQIALGQASSVSSELASEKTIDLVAVKLLADYEQGKDVVIQAKKLAEQYGQDNLTVQLCAGMVLERAGDTEGALEVLSKHQGSLDA
jgi:hypothetical protein